MALAEGVFGRLSGTRLRDELVRLLDDSASAVKGVERLAELALLPALHPELVLDPEASRRVAAAAAALDWYRLAGVEDLPVCVWRLFLVALAWGLDGRGLEQLADRLALAGADRQALVAGRDRITLALERLGAASLAPHRAAAALAPLAGEEILLVMALGDERQRQWVRRELTEFRRLRLAIGGADLLARGVPSGPAVGRALSATREARLDGRIAAAEELEFALEVAAADPQGQPPEEER